MPHYRNLRRYTAVILNKREKSVPLHDEISCQKSVTSKNDPHLILLIEEGVLAVARGSLIARPLAWPANPQLAPGPYPWTRTFTRIVRACLRLRFVGCATRSARRWPLCRTSSPFPRERDRPSRARRRKRSRAARRRRPPARPLRPRRPPALLLQRPYVQVTSNYED